MTDDQQFWLGLVTLIVPTIGSVLAYRKAAATHTAVNGVVAKGIRRARAQGRAQGTHTTVVLPTKDQGDSLHTP